MKSSLFRFTSRVARSLSLTAFIGLVHAQTLTVTPSATDYSPTGGTVSYDVTITYSSVPAALALRVITPADWTYAGTSGSEAPTCLDPLDTRQGVSGEGFGWFYFTAPASPARFTVRFGYPAGQTGNKSVAFTALYHAATGAVVSVTPSESVPALVPGATAPTIATQPSGATVLAGSSATFEVTAAGTAPFTYQWNKAGRAISGATQSSYTVVSSTESAGSYTVTVSNSKGSVTSAAAVLVLGEPARITTQPVDTQVAPGANGTLTVAARGPSLGYQWSFNSTPIAGATNASYIITGATGAHTGYYQVTITSATDPTGVRSNTVLLQVAYAGMSAAQQLVVTPGRGYLAGGTVRIDNTFTFPSNATALGWTVYLPPGFSLASETSGASYKPAVGTTQRLEWAWATGSITSPVTFSYVLNVPNPATGAKTLSALAYVRINNETLPVISTPEQLTVSPSGLPHSSDIDADWKIGISELAHTIALFNTSNSNVRTGAYRYVATDSGSPFVEDPSRSVAATNLTNVHSADTNADGMIDLKELLQLIDLYNYRTGAERTGHYHWQADESAPGSDRYAGGP